MTLPDVIARLNALLDTGEDWIDARKVDRLKIDLEIALRLAKEKAKTS